MTSGHVPMSNFQLGLSFPEAGIVGIAEFEAARRKKLKCKEKNNLSLNNSNNNHSSIEELKKFSQTLPAISLCREASVFHNKIQNLSMNANPASQINMSKNNSREDSQSKSTNLKMEPRNISG